MPKLTKITKDNARLLVAPGIRQLKDMAEGLQASIENFEFGLSQGLKEDYERLKGTPNAITRKQSRRLWRSGRRSRRLVAFRVRLRALL